MEKNRYQILRKNIPNVKLVSLTGQTWYDSNDDTIPWSGSYHNGTVYIGPNQNDIIYNITGSISTGYYKWTGTTWNSITQSEAYDDHNLPLFLESDVDEMGVMVGFDGDIEQVEQLCNFHYSGSTGNTILTVFNTVNQFALRSIVEQTYSIEWGDGTTTTGFTVSTGVTVNSTSHTYSTGGTYNVVMKLVSPWTTQKITKQITLPIANPNVISNPLGTFTGYTVPSYSNLTGQTQDYLTDLDYTNNTGFTITGFTYLAIGGSRIDEKKLYGGNTYSGVTTGTTSGVNWTGYSFTYTGNTTGTTQMYYRDYADGYTLITGTTTGFTKEEVFNLAITRNEHFLGFVDEPTVYSDIFVERGKQGVMEKNLRLCEIDNTGELDVYGNGYFNVKKQ